MADNVASALAYVPVLGPLVFLLMEPYNKNKGIRFHAWQSLFVLGLYIVASIVVNILTDIAFGLYRLHSLVHLAYLVLSFFIAYKAYTGEKMAQIAAIVDWADSGKTGVARRVSGASNTR